MQQRVLICSVNWLGDLVMSLPALQLYRARHPDTQIDFIAKPAIAPLVSLSPVAGSVHLLHSGIMGTLRAGRVLGKNGYRKAFVFPNSFRSALLPFQAHIPRRQGAAGHCRRALLTDQIDSTPQGDARVHQSWEYARILGLDPLPDALPAPQLLTPEGALDTCLRRLGLGLDDSCIGLIPGAARGPAKCWPATSFIDLGKSLADRHGSRLLVFGAPNERELCEHVAVGIGDAAVSLGGLTSVTELIALLSKCRLAVTNDSGGMHLAAASGTPVVAVFGITDPSRTGPLGTGHQIIRADGVSASRDIPRDSAEARRAMESISPEGVLGATERTLFRPAETPT